MATTNYKVLGQVAPAALNSNNIYTVPSDTEAVVSTITVCNRGTTAGTYRVAVRPNGATLSNTHYVAYDAVLLGNDTVALTLGITCDAADVITVRPSTANFSFSVFGSEIS